VQSLVYTWNTDNTIDELTTTTSTSDYNFYFTYTGGNVTQLDINDKISSPDIHATYTLNTDKLPSGSEYSTGDYDTSTWALAGTGTYTYEPTFGLLTNSTLGSIATYDMTYDSRGKQLSFSQDKSGIIYDYYTVVTYDSNGNISTADYYGEIPIVPPADLTVAFTWQAL
jgi:hypothetical protein